MNTIMPNEFPDVMDTIHYRPAVSLIMPFEPKMSSKNNLADALRTAVDKVEIELSENYPDEISRLVMQKLRSIISGINYSTHKKSLAIFVSPVFEKILYLDMIVEEKVIIDESFEIRDILYSKKQMHGYLVLVLNSNKGQMYLGKDAALTRIISATSQAGPDYEKHVAEHVANFTDSNALHEISLDKFMHHIDNSLDIILKAYPLPLFIIGPARVLGHFKKVTGHSKTIVGCIYGNHENATPRELKDVLEPYLSDWEKINRKDLLNQLEEAVSGNKLVVGMEKVWRDATAGKGRLLLIEKNYMYAAEHGGSNEIIYKAIEPYNKYSYIKDAVDDVIEKVLQLGGDVEFVDKDLLQDYDHIALIKYY